MFAAFSVALIVSALLGPFAGRAIDRHGGRRCWWAPTYCLPPAWGHGAGAKTRGPVCRAWVLMGVAMGSGLYGLRLPRWCGYYSRGAARHFPGITLIAGFASTVGWPLSAWMETQWGWRGACAG